MKRERAMRASRASGAGLWGPRQRARVGGAAGTKSPRIMRIDVIVGALHLA
jgi:hypothetical protein